MMAAISKCDFVNRLIFVNPGMSIRNIFNSKKSRINAGSNGTTKLFPSKVESKIFVYTPINFIPSIKFLSALKKIEIKIMLKIVRRLNKYKPYILVMNCPNIFSNYFLDELLKNAALSIFDFSDDFSELEYGEKAKELFMCNMAKYAKKADIVLTVNDHVKSKYTSLNSNIHVIRNATNYFNFDRKNYKSIDVLEMMKSSKNPIIGYSGIANMGRIDSGLLDYLLEMRPDWQFVFVGPAHAKFVVNYLHYKNVHHILPVSYQELPDYIHYFDVAIVPFKENDNTRGNDLLKLHDYLAMGKPVVSTAIGGANDLRGVIRIAKGPSDFLGEMEKALHCRNDEEVLMGKNVALANSWHNRVSELEHLMKNSLGI